MSKTKHIDRYPLAPSAFAQAMYNSISNGLQYKTGPRMGQQLADARWKSLEIATSNPVMPRSAP